MAHFTKQEIEEIRIRLAATGVKDSQFPSVTTVNLDDFIAIVQDGKNKKATLSDILVHLGEEIFENFIFSVHVYVKNGANILHGGTSADIEAEVLLGDKNVTQQIPQKCYSWKRSSKNHAADELWNLQHTGVGSEIHITQIDVNRNCTFYCVIPADCLRNINI